MPYTSILDSFTKLKCVEPQKRLVNGSFGWAVHRFPIRDGITLREALFQDLSRTNPLLTLLRKQS